MPQRILAISIGLITTSITPAMAQSMEKVCAGYQRQYNECYARFEQIKRNNLANIATIKDPYERRATERAMLEGAQSIETICGPFKKAMWDLGCP
jgi:hypothetical protein